MRKSFAAILLLIILVISSRGTVHAAPQPSSKETTEKLTHDTLLTTLFPYLQQAVTSYYGHPKQFDLFNAKILHIKREREGGFGFIVNVQVKTFEGAHNPPYGTETITIDVNPARVSVTDYKHKDG
ncbi:DUF3888 domain-containing protein [Paenibacillus roseipurpureus]|uniref:DUF3888 domain-containing protein n=1 Tax=Paenibacillus roseopurpureus TaxID=2918901 RepID=A0AA96LPV0_9BACL|nr:DUF3888 domain-containing protein [Paenibacillus sp. MBLB1832]WNR45053.1 DUF3888 domain-containing protein [Paenibacillus sp. MBLB1832]